MIWNSVKTIRTPVKLASVLTMATLIISIGCSDDTTCPVPADPPRITSHYPADGDTLVPPDTFLTITFDMTMDPATVSAGSFTLEGPRGPVGVTVLLDGTTATLTPFELMAGRSIYTARVAAGVSSKAGTPMGVDHAWSFITDFSPLLLHPEIEFTVRDSDGDAQPDSIYGNGPPGHHLLMGDIGAVEDRAVMEFPLGEIVHDEVLEAMIILTVYDVTSENTPIRMEAWSYSGNGTAETADWNNGHLIAGYDLEDIRTGHSYVFPLTDSINYALAEGATHVGFRVVLSGGPHAQIYTMNGSEDDWVRLILYQ